MRIRQVKPAFWADSRLAELAERTRLFYIGLWMIADDAGWLRWDAVEVARDLYGYETRGKREKRVREMFADLIDAKRVVLYGCGHAEIPKMPDHQRLAGPTKQVRTYLNEHLKEAGSRRSTEPPRDPPQVTAYPRPERLGTDMEQERERNGEVRNGNGTDENPSELTTRLLEHGVKPELIA